MMADKNTSIYDLIGIGNIRKKYPPQTSTEKTVMQTVIGDMMSAYPSESYGIIFGSHGSDAEHDICALSQLALGLEADIALPALKYGR